MKRNPFVLRFKDGKKEEGLAVIGGFWNECKGALKRTGIENFSIWSIEDFLFCYGEFPDEVKLSPADQAGFEAWRAALAPVCDVFAAQGTLPLMYHDIGIVRADKSLIRHRVFATKLKEGCAAEYKRRHDGLIEKRGDKITEGPESNFTIWNANGYIFGYCELVKSFDHEMTEEEKASTIAWETRQLEIMDWLTDDVDWITGQKHDSIKLVAQE